MVTEAYQIMALDVGSVRIGVATASSIARVASPLKYIANDKDVYSIINQLIVDNEVKQLVVGLPLNIEGEPTKQTEYIKQFVEKLKQSLDTKLSIDYADESSTSQLAEKQLQAGKKSYQKGDIDAMSASYILQRYLDDSSIANVPQETVTN